MPRYVSSLVSKEIQTFFGYDIFLTHGPRFLRSELRYGFLFYIGLIFSQRIVRGILIASYFSLSILSVL